MRTFLSLPQISVVPEHCRGLTLIIFGFAILFTVTSSVPVRAAGYVAIGDWVMRGKDIPVDTPSLEIDQKLLPYEYYRIYPVPDDPILMSQIDDSTTELRGPGRTILLANDFTDTKGERAIRDRTARAARELLDELRLRLVDEGGSYYRASASPERTLFAPRRNIAWNQDRVGAFLTALHSGAWGVYRGSEEDTSYTGSGGEFEFIGDLHAAQNHMRLARYELALAQLDDRQRAGPFQQHAGPFQQHAGPFQQHAGPFQQHAGPLVRHATSDYFRRRAHLLSALCHIGIAAELRKTDALLPGLPGSDAAIVSRPDRDREALRHLQLALSDLSNNDQPDMDWLATRGYLNWALLRWRDAASDLSTVAAATADFECWLFVARLQLAVDDQASASRSIAAAKIIGAAKASSLDRRLAQARISTLERRIAATPKVP